MLRAGGFLVRDVDTRARLDAVSAPIGTYIDFDDTLGGETSANVARLDAYWRFGLKHRIDVSYYDLRFDGSRVIDTQIDWGDQTFPINTGIDSRLTMRVLKAAYVYSFYRNDDVELAASAGLHTMRVSMALEEINGLRAQSEAVTAPLPVLGFQMNYRFTDRWTALLRMESFFVSIEDRARGSLTDYMLGIEYRLFRNVALGAAYERFALFYEGRDDRFRLTVDQSWYGLLAYAALYF